MAEDFKCLVCGRDTHAFQHDPWPVRLICKYDLEKIVTEWLRKQKVGGGGTRDTPKKRGKQKLPPN
jgi:hypothetical protein